jgi:5-methylcytosine-specific restriction endonuclease McrA
MARVRDNNTCQNCSKTKEMLGKNLDVHHIIPFRNFGVGRHEEANRLYNLISYCNKCHKIIEEQYNKSVNSGDHYSI